LNFSIFGKQEEIQLNLIGNKKVKMKLLSIFQKIWLVAGACAMGMGLYRLVELKSLHYKVYFPFICAVLCSIVYWNIGQQIKMYDQKNKN
jgi:hypothetical protein